MSESLSQPTGWWAKGLLFENCNCTLICPGHIHFSQPCTHERCLGYWAIRFDEGECEGVDLTGVSVVITYNSPRHMIEGGWTEQLIIDRDAPKEQRRLIEEILTGQRGGPWKVLAQFVATQLPTEYRAIRIEEEARTKQVHVVGFIESTIEAIKGRDRARPVLLSNMFNQIHNPEQELAFGSSSCSAIGLRTNNTHALASRFSWKVD